MDKHLQRMLAVFIVMMGLACFFPFLPAMGAEAELDLEHDPLFEGIPLVKGPHAQPLGEQAVIRLPRGYYFISGQHCAEVLGRMGNTAAGNELGMVLPADMSWMLLFYFDFSGTVALPNPSSLDLPSLLKSVQVEQGKKTTSNGFLQVKDWTLPPVIDLAHHTAEWSFQAINPEAGSGSFSTYAKAFFGREGVITALLADDLAQSSLPELRKVLGQVAFLPGKNYTDKLSTDAAPSMSFQDIIIRSWAREKNSEARVNPLPLAGGALAALAAGGAAAYYFLKKKVNAS